MNGPWGCNVLQVRYDTDYRKLLEANPWMLKRSLVVKVGNYLAFFSNELARDFSVVPAAWMIIFSQKAVNCTDSRTCSLVSVGSTTSWAWI